MRQKASFISSQRSWWTISSYFYQFSIRLWIRRGPRPHLRGSQPDRAHRLPERMGCTPAHAMLSAADSVSRAQILQMIDAEVAQLPARQREAFLLRYWEELDVAETAASMGCSEGSVKTHCSRAVHALAKALKAKGISTT